jgi:hypothetical protein
LMHRAESGGLPQASADRYFVQKAKVSLFLVDWPKKWAPSQGAKKQTSVGMCDGSAESEYALLFSPG